MANNTLYVVQGHDHPWLQSRALVADDTSWVTGQQPPAGPLTAKTRYRQTDAACTLTAPAEGPVAERFELRFSAAQWAVTPGQSAVLYDGEVCLGGGVIAEVENWSVGSQSTERPFSRSIGVSELSPSARRDSWKA
jgi:tRNA-specific 2-thiouridylase